MIKVKKNPAATSSKQENKKGATNCTGINYQQIPEELELHWDDDCKKFKVDEEAVSELSNSIEDWVSVGIYLQLLDLMRGLEPKLAYKVARYVGDFCWGQGRTVTGIEWLDSQLLSLYQRIYAEAQSLGHKLEMPECLF